MNKSFEKKLTMCKKSIDWWQQESMHLAFEAEELDYMYEMGLYTDEEILVKTRELNQKMSYLMSKGMFEHNNLFEIFTNETQ